ncbi:PTS system mannose/fructose/sorbose family transporter subunit IID [Petroclostridium sp. X23]|uniref:PTS system mannose/fructose/sorbose family transporter subunit IID n=1 Tax=Petroclostridium sp. X23 TaxID=3045146 RepID=UPI0024AE3FAF|nr:PTS system mannose/fructose/sorbose family transporter subunit IID [Petroclostridium sp. X23]WHH60499.1 PTS system mannose/fructose/sorbose family transporter subunit IID [Petroclostridium sp. X23]
MSDVLIKDEVKAGNDSTLTKKDINKAYFRWYIGCEVSNSYERMQAVAFCYSMIPVLKKLYKEKKEYCAALCRHLNFFNSQGTWGTPIHGITIAMEEQKAKGEKISEATIASVKTGLMGPLAGIGDTIDWGTLKTIIYGLAVTFGMSGSILGSFIPVIFMVITLVIGNLLWNLGYSVGKESVRSILEAGWIKELIMGTSILGLFMMGSLSASYVKLSIPLTLTIAKGNEVGLQSMLDSIVPGILPLSVVFGLYYILKKRKQNYGLISLAIVLISILGSLIGIF